jgi:hypothetical protein
VENGRWQPVVKVLARPLDQHLTQPVALYQPLVIIVIHQMVKNRIAQRPACQPCRQYRRKLLLGGCFAQHQVAQVAQEAGHFGGTRSCEIAHGDQNKTIQRSNSSIFMRDGVLRA